MRQILTFTLTIFAILTLSPLMILIAVSIYLEDRESIFFLQERVGLRETPFIIYKFRTMINGNITPIGKILRKTGLDELPQLLNIISGDMSIVGPRPLTKSDINRLGWNQYKFIKRFSVKPGLTGLSQIYDGKTARISTCFDFSYLKIESFMTDFRIILITFAMNIFGKEKIKTILWNNLKQRKRNPNWNIWFKYFKKNSFAPIRNRMDTIENLSSEKIVALRRSMAIFQLGESGEGRIAKQIESISIFGVNDLYRQCIKLFVKEEGKHARVLGLIVQALGGKILTQNWTDFLFSFGRRLLGIRLKLLVLLTAEAVSVSFYQLFIRQLPLSGMRAALIEITRDEEFHLQFHTEFFKVRIHSLTHKFIFKLVWRLITLLAFLVVTLDHRKSLKTFGISIYFAFSEYSKIVFEVEEEICNIQKEKTTHYFWPAFFT